MRTGTTIRETLTSVKAAIAAKLAVIATFLGNWLKDPWHFRIYGDSLMTPRLSRELGWIALVLGLQLVIDLWAWNRAWSFGLPLSLVVAAVLCNVFAISILAYDRSIVTLDTSRTKTAVWPLGLRGVILVAICLITAVPVELSVFESETDKRIAAKEKIDLDAIRSRAQNEETVRFDGDIAKAGEELKAVQAGSILLQRQATDFKDMRARQRQELLDSRTRESEAKTEALAQQRDVFNAEVDGSGGSGHYGMASAALGKKQVLDEMEATKAAFNTETVQIMTRFDNDTASGVKARENTAFTQATTNEEAVKTRIADLRTRKDTAIRDLQTMDGDLLAVKYGGDWRRSKGFLDRFNELSEMADESLSVTLMIWGCRFVMMLLGLLILGLKIMASEDLKVYYSRAHQYAAGHPETQASMAATGFSASEALRKAVGYDHRIRDLLEELAQARRKLAMAYEKFLREVARLATERSAKQSIHFSLGHIREGLHQYWVDKVLPAVEKVRECESTLLLRGIDQPEWPKELGDSDPSQLEDPWKVTGEDLNQNFGWVDPNTKDLLGRLDEARWALTQAWRRFQTTLHASCGERNLFSIALARDLILVRLKDVWVDEVEPKIRDLMVVEREFEVAGAELPSWPNSLCDGIDPRTIPNPITPTAAQLVSFGWQDPATSKWKGDQALQELLKFRRKVEQVLKDLEDKLSRAVFADKTVPKDEMRRRHEGSRNRQYREEVLPALTGIREQEEILRSLGREIPEWKPDSFQIADLPLTDWWRVRADMLTYYGWLGKMRECPHCQATMGETWANCMSCGKAWTEPVATPAAEVLPTPAPEPEPPALQMVICKKCRSEYVLGQRICVKCGRLLPLKIKPPEPTPEPEPPAPPVIPAPEPTPELAPVPTPGTGRKPGDTDPYLSIPKTP